MQQDQPCVLHVLNLGCGPRECVAAPTRSANGGKHNRRVQEGFPTLGCLVRRSGPVTRAKIWFWVLCTCDSLESIAHGWAVAGSVPDLWSSPHEPGCRSVFSTQPEHTREVAPPLPQWGGDDERVVEKRKETFASGELAARGFQCAMLTRRAQQWHHWIALFASFTLRDAVNLGIVHLPQTLGTPTVEHAREWQSCR